MTDRLSGCTVVFDRDIRVDDAEEIMKALRMLRFVVRVEPIGSDWLSPETMRYSAKVHTKLLELAHDLYAGKP